MNIFALWQACIKINHIVSLQAVYKTSPPKQHHHIWQATLNSKPWWKQFPSLRAWHSYELLTSIQVCGWVQISIIHSSSGVMISIIYSHIGHMISLWYPECTAIHVPTITASCTQGLRDGLSSHWETWQHICFDKQNISLVQVMGPHPVVISWIIAALVSISSSEQTPEKFEWK